MTTTKAKSAIEKAVRKPKTPVLTVVEDEPVPSYLDEEDDAVEDVEEPVYAAKAAIETPVKTATDALAGAAAFGQLPFDAIFKVGDLVSRSFETVGAEVMASAQDTLSSGIAVAQGVLGCRSLDDLVSVQSRFAETAVENAMKQSAKFTELSTSLFGAAMEVFTAPVKGAVGDLYKPSFFRPTFL